MNISRRHFLLTGSLFTTGLVSGCITKKLYQPDSYQESVSSILITEDKKIIVVITQKYHYIFEAPEVLIKTLESPFHKSVFATFETFSVDSSRNTTGEFMLVLSDSASEDDKQQAIAAGYQQHLSGQIVSRQYTVKDRLVGKRYDANNIFPKADSQKLNKTYEIYVQEEKSLGEKALNSLATPITLAADGILLIGMMPFYFMSIGLFEK